MPISMLMPMLRYRCRDFQMAKIKKDWSFLKMLSFQISCVILDSQELLTLPALV